MFLDQLNARIAVKKQAQELSSISPLERMTKAIKADVATSNSVLVQKDWAAWNAKHRKGTSIGEEYDYKNPVTGAVPKGKVEGYGKETSDFLDKHLPHTPHNGYSHNRDFNGKDSRDKALESHKALHEHLVSQGFQPSKEKVTDSYYKDKVEGATASVSREYEHPDGRRIRSIMSQDAPKKYDYKAPDTHSHTVRYPSRAPSKTTDPE